MDNVQQIVLGQDKGFVNPNTSTYSLYANMFTAGQTISDIYIIGLLNGTPNFTINLSFTAAKNLHAALTTILKRYEDYSDTPIPTIDDIRKLMDKANEANKIETK